MTGRLDGKVVLITGAGQGIGREHATYLAGHGASVVVNDYRLADDSTPSAAEEVVRQIQEQGGTAVADHGDVSSWDDSARTVQLAVETYGHLDVLVNNAGVLHPSPIWDVEESDFRRTVDVHLGGAYALTRAAARHWRQRHQEGEIVNGRVVNTTSGAGLYGITHASAYAAAKAAVAGLTLVCGRELAEFGVTVNAIAPSAATQMSRHVPLDLPAANCIPPLVAWLASDAAGDVTGRVFNVYGGHVSVAEGWRAGPGAETDGVWTLDALDYAVPDLLRRTAPMPNVFGNVASST